MTINNVGVRFGRLMKDTPHVGKQKARTGRLNDDETINSSPTEDAGQNKIWVRIGATEEDPAGSGEVVAWNLGANAVRTDRADIPVLIRPNIDGDYEIVGVDALAADEGFGPVANDQYGVDRSPENNTNVLTTRSIADLRVTYDQVNGGLWLHVAPGLHSGGRWPGDSIDLAAALPVTADRKAWVAVGLNTATNLLELLTGTEYVLPWAMELSEAAALPFAAGVWPLAAVVLTDTQAAFTYRRDEIVDLRRIVNGDSADPGELSDLTDVDTTGVADGDTLIYDAGTTTWLVGAPVGSGLTLIDQQILLSDTATVTFSSIPGTYKLLRLVISARCDQATSQDGRLQFNGDTANNYNWQSFGASGGSTGAADSIAASYIRLGEWAGTGAAAGAASTAEAIIPNYAAGWHKNVQVSAFSVEPATGGAFALYTQGGTWEDVAAITSIELTLVTGNWLTGSIFTLWAAS